MLNPFSQARILGAVVLLLVLGSLVLAVIDRAYPTDVWGLD